MKNWMMGLVLAVLAGTAWAQAGGLMNAGIEDRTSIEDPAVAVRAMSGEQLIVFASISSGEVQDVRLVGEQCPVDGAGAQVTWIGDTDTEASLNWLLSMTRGSKTGAKETALYAIALHESPEATEHLLKLASEPGNDMSQEALFWLANSDDDQALAALEELLTR